jgi:entericidin B
MQRMMIVYTAIATSLLLSACNTMEGVGKDVQKGGKKIERSANKHK